MLIKTLYFEDNLQITKFLEGSCCRFEVVVLKFYQITDACMQWNARGWDFHISSKEGTMFISLWRNVQAYTVTGICITNFGQASKVKDCSKKY